MCGQNSDADTDAFEEMDDEAAIDSVIQEVISICAETCETREEYNTQLRRLCTQPGRCPESFVEEIQAW